MGVVDQEYYPEHIDALLIELKNNRELTQQEIGQAVKEFRAYLRERERHWKQRLKDEQKLRIGKRDELLGKVERLEHELRFAKEQLGNLTAQHGDYQKRIVEAEDAKQLATQAYNAVKRRMKELEQKLSQQATSFIEIDPNVNLVRRLEAAEEENKLVHAEAEQYMDQAGKVIAEKNTLISKLQLEKKRIEQDFSSLKEGFGNERREQRNKYAKLQAQLGGMQSALQAEQQRWFIIRPRKLWAILCEHFWR